MATQPHKNLQRVKLKYCYLNLLLQQLNKEVEKYGGDILLGFEEGMYTIKKQVEMWTEVALHIFNRHRPENGSDYPEHERLLQLNKVREAQRLNGGSILNLYSL